MKKRKRLWLHSRMFNGFLVSSIGLVLLAMYLVLTMSFRHIENNMHAEEIRILENKMRTIAEDMDNQMDSMRKMVVKIVSEKKFSWEYIRLHKYHEIEMLKELKSYSNFSAVFQNYFIKYDHHDTIFTSGGTTMSLERYFSEKHGLNNTSAIIEFITLFCQDSQTSLSMYREDDVTLILYSMHAYAPKGSEKNGVIGFVLSDTELKNRVERIAGHIYGDLSIFKGDFCFYGAQEIDWSQALVVSSKEDNFRICVLPDTENYFSWRNIFSIEEIIIFSGIVFMLLLASFIVSCWNYMPFRKVIDKYDLTADGKKVLDWSDIDSLIEDILHAEETSSKKLEIQQVLLREQAIHMIFDGGGYSDRMQKYLALLSINLDYSVFGVIRIVFEQESEECGEYMLKSIEDLSGDGFSLYSCRIEKRMLWILVAADEEYQLDEAVELLQSLFKTLEFHISIEMRKCRDLKSVSQIYGKTDATDVDKKVLENKKSSGKRRNTAKQIIEYIETHCTDYNLTLDILSHELGISVPYLCMVIKQEIGMSYKEYLTKLRIEEAKKLLMEEYISVSDVCQRVGYINVSYFIKIFQKYTGVTPTRYIDEYRESYKQNSKGANNVQDN